MGYYAGKWLKAGRCLFIEANERLLMLKLMNGLYGVSLADNALNTQEYLSKIILFLKYYTSDEYRLVKFKDELAMIRLFGELMTAGTGNRYSITVNFGDDDCRNLNIPSKSLLLLALDMLVFQNNAAEAQGNMIFDVRSEGHTFYIFIAGSYFSDIIKIQQRAAEIKKAFEAAYGPEVQVELSNGKKDYPEIRLTLFPG